MRIFALLVSPKLGMIVVKKRGSARFFARDPRNPRQLINPPPGTIIDHTITNQGTIRTRDFPNESSSNFIR